MNPESKPIIAFAEFELDIARRRLLRNGEPLALNAKAFDLLTFLAENAGRVLTKEEILDAVWENQFIEEANLTVQISTLRKALGDSRENPRFLVTLPGKGYKFVAELNGHREEEVIIETEKIERIRVVEEYSKDSTPAALLETGAASKSFFKTWRVVIAGLVLTAILSVGGYFLLKKKTNIFITAQDFSLKKLTSTGNVRAASLSSDGKFFAYTVEKQNQHSLWLGNVDGGEPLQLRPFTEGDFISMYFAPDANILYYVLADNQQLAGALYKIPVIGGVPEKVRDRISSPVSFSSDGKQFVFTRADEENDKVALILADVDSTDERELVVRPYAQRFARFSPSFSPDGAMIAFAAIVDESGTLQLFTANVADGSVRPISNDGWNFVRSTAWLKDQSGILLVGEPKTSNDGRWQIYYISYPDGAMRQFYPDLNSYGSSLSLSADDKTLLTVKNDLTSNIWVAPAADLSRAKQITFSSLARLDGWNGLDWTPNGKIFYTAVADKTKTIWTMDADGSNQKQLVPNGGENIYPVASDDSRLVVFQSNRSGKPAIWRVDSPDGGNLRQITEDFTGEPTVSPDGRWVVYSKVDEDFGGLWRISTDGGEPLKLIGNAGWGRISPDGKFVACQYKSDGKTKLAVLSIDGGEPVKLFDTPPDANFRFSLRWTPDGKAVTYRDWIDGIWFQSLDKSAPERLPDLPHEKFYAYDWSPDGKFLAFTRGSLVLDVVLINNGK
jgi:Tol biopolymer transport system component/DNA-binding winged helix-turn-helix (wHTH) protein